MSTAPTPKGIRDIDGEKINRLVDAIRTTVEKVPTVIDAVMARGVTVTHSWLGTLTIKLGPNTGDNDG